MTPENLKEDGNRCKPSELTIHIIDKAFKKQPPPTKHTHKKTKQQHPQNSQESC